MRKVKIFPPQVWRNKETMYRLIAAKCTSCGNVMFPARDVCNKCGSTKVTKVRLSGKGTLISYTVNYQSLPGMEKVQPSYIGLIKLDEGIEIVAPLTDVDENLREGARVEATIRRIRADSTNGLIEYGVKFRLVENEPNR